MNKGMDMETVDLYVSEVGRRLPEKTRADIEQEIGSMIEDTLEDESQQQGRPVDDAMVMAVLNRLGSPEKMAASYLPARYLIGPEIFPTFLLVTRVVITVTLAFGVIGLGISLGMSNLAAAEIGQRVLQTVGNLFNSVLTAFGWIVIVFAVIQWVVVKKSLKFRQLDWDWDPSKLKKTPKHEADKFNATGLAAEVVLTITALVLFNAFPQYVGVGSVRDGQWVIVSVLAPAFFTYLPWISLLWALKATVDIVALGQGRWTVGLRWALVGLGLGSIILAYRILTGPAIVAFPPDAITRLGWGTATAMSIQQLSNLVNSAVRLSIAVALVVEVIETAGRLIRLLLQLTRPALISFQDH